MNGSLKEKLEASLKLLKKLQKLEEEFKEKKKKLEDKKCDYSYAESVDEFADCLSEQRAQVRAACVESFRETLVYLKRIAPCQGAVNHPLGAFYRSFRSSITNLETICAISPNRNLSVKFNGAKIFLGNFDIDNELLTLIKQNISLAEEVFTEKRAISSEGSGGRVIRTQDLGSPWE